MLTQQEYQAYKAAFEAGNETVNYTFRNVTVMDEEESRIVDEMTDNADKWIDRFPLEIRSQVRTLAQAICDHYNAHKSDPRPLLNRTVPGQSLNDACSELADVLKPYISNRELWNRSTSLWEDIFFDTDYADLETEDLV